MRKVKGGIRKFNFPAGGRELNFRGRGISFFLFEGISLLREES